MRSNFIWSSAIALAVALSSVSYADTVELNLRDSGTSLGDNIERDVNALPGGVDDVAAAAPLVFPVDEGGDVVEMGSESLIVSLLSVSSNDTGATVISASAAVFAINSAGGLADGESSVNFDSNFEEEITFSFNLPVEIQEIDFIDFDVGEQFQVGTQVIGSGDVTTTDVADLTRDPIIVPANTPITFSPIAATSGGPSSIGLQEIILHVKTDTEPLLGDVNMDGSVDLLDVAPFVQLLTNGQFQIEADVNQDGEVDLLDVGPFVDLITGA